MKKLRIKVKCPFCGSKFYILFPLNLLGRKASMSCSTCKKPLKVVLPEELKNRFQPILVLDVQGKEGGAQRIELTSDYYTVGHKSSWNDFRPTLEVKNGKDQPTLKVADRLMARKDAVIRKHNNEFTIQNVGRSGIVLNGERIVDRDDICYLHDGDILIVGQTVIKVSIGYQDTAETLCKEKQS